MYNEYQYREKELTYLITTYTKRYKWIEDVEFIKLLLAMSIYYRRIIAQLDASINFTDRIFKLDDGKGVLIGTYELNKGEIENIKKAVNNFNAIMRRFYIHLYLFDYDDVKMFLFKIKKHLENLDKFYEEI